MIGVEQQEVAREGVTGDLLQKVITQALQTWDNHPGSIFAYAVWAACSELSRHFEDQQGMPTSEFNRINALMKSPLEELVRSGGLISESGASQRALTHFLEAMRLLR
jgi:hypothetical protein